jgi:hypothetical protein
MRDYVYAPKDDPKHRHEWRAPYDAHELAGFERFAEDGALTLGFAISPGLSIDADSADDRADLAAKVDQVVAVGARRVVLALDDIPFGGGAQGEAHARLTTWLREHLGGRAHLSLIPTEYVGVASTPHLDALAEGVPADVPIGWTGRAVVNDSISIADVNERAASLGGRPPLLWDNYPVNDAVMGDQLFVGPIRGREAGLGDACAGYLANPMEHARASKLPLASIAALLRGEDPDTEWRSTAADLGWLAFASACDGVEASAVVASGDRAAARSLFGDAAVCAAPGLEDEAAAWITQVQRDARLALTALDVLDGERAVETILGMGVRWQASRRSPTTAFGPRCSLRVLIGQAADGTWQVEPGAIQHDENAVDALVGQALDAL